MHPGDLASVILVLAAIGFMMYRRVRRTLGRQRLRSRRMIVRMVLLAIICVLLLASPATTLARLGYALAGAVLGVGLARYSIRHTRFEQTAEGRFYTANVYIGLGVAALLIGRVLYRLIQIYPTMQAAAAQGAGAPLGGNLFASSFSSPVTVGLYFIMAGYYIAYYIGLLRWIPPLPAVDSET